MKSSENNLTSEERIRDHIERLFDSKKELLETVAAIDSNTLDGDGILESERELAKSLKEFLGWKLFSEAEKSGKLPMVVRALVLKEDADAETTELIEKYAMLKKEIINHTKYLNQINWKHLEEDLTEILNCQISLEYRLNQKSRIEFHSQDLSEFTGIMSQMQMYEYFRITDFGTYVSKFRESAFSDEWETVFSTSVHFDFKYRGGGSNGTAFAYVWYNFNTKKWIIRRK